MESIITGDLCQDAKALDAALHRSINPDMHVRRIRVSGKEAAVYYADGLVSADFLQHYVLMPLLALYIAPDEDQRAGIANAVCNCDVAEAKTIDAAAVQVMNGRAVLLVQGMTQALGFDVRMFVRRGIAPPLTETVVQGPHQGFNESIRDCITLVRRILPTPEMISEMRTIGSTYPTAMSILYLNDRVDRELLTRIKNRLDGIRTEHVMSIGALQQLLEDRPWSLLPQCCLTERPDRAASMLLEGQIAIILDGSPQVLVLPCTLWHMLHTSDDTSARWQYGTFLRLIRMVGMLAALLLPGLFVAFVTFHPEALPVTLLTAILESQAAVPFSIPLETLLMLMLFNLVGEASIRVPSAAGSTLGTVSGLILGQAAVEAKLIHPLLLIVIAVSSLGSYVAPDYSLGLAVRIGQLVLLLAGCVFGVYGMVLFLTAGVIRLCSLTSLGTPMLAPLSPHRVHNPDTLTRMPLWRQRFATWLAGADASSLHGPMRGWDRRRR